MPVPDGPTRRTPLGGDRFSRRNFEGNCKGNRTSSWRVWNGVSSPGGGGGGCDNSDCDGEMLS